MKTKTVKPKHLYIIGNGFDLHHCINSSYRNFWDWLEIYNPDVYSDFFNIYEDIEGEWWSDFENNIASLNIYEYSTRIACEYQPDLMSEHCDSMWDDAQFEVERQLKTLYANIKDCFHDWIEQLNPPLRSRSVNLQIKDSAFLSFNYTKTLENLYGVDNRSILHIHGCVDENEDFVLGHGKTQRAIILMNMGNHVKAQEAMTDEEVEALYDDGLGGLELHEQFALSSAMAEVEAMKKPVDELIQKHAQFFDSLSDVQDVHVYGLSLSEIDIPYLRLIVSKLPSAQWEFSRYNDKDIEKIRSFCCESGLRNYTMINLMDITEVGQLKLSFPKGQR